MCFLDMQFRFIESVVLNVNAYLTDCRANHLWFNLTLRSHCQGYDPHFRIEIDCNLLFFIPLFHPPTLSKGINVRNISLVLFLSPLLFHNKEKNLILHLIISMTRGVKNNKWSWKWTIILIHCNRKGVEDCIYVLEPFKFNSNL